MEWLKNNGDRFALLVISLIAIAGSGLMIAKSFSFSDEFVYDNVTGDDRKRNVPPTGAADAEASREAIDQDVVWEPPSLEGKPEVPIFKSVVRIQKGNQIYDPQKTSEVPVRPPMTNAFLLEHGLDYTRTDVAQLDKDDDGFSNVDEFNGVRGVSTDPTDPNDHPPLTNKLFVKERVEIPYVIIFSGSSGDLFQVGEKKQGGRMNRLFVKKGQTFFDGRFTALGFRMEKIFDEAIQIEREVGILSVRDNTSGQTIDLIQRKEYNLPSYIGIFLYTFRVDSEIQVKQGETFKMTGEPKTFKLIEIMESEALISPSDEEGAVAADAPKIRIPNLSARNVKPLRPPPGTTPPVTPPVPVPGTTTPPAPAPVGPGTTPPVTPPVPVPGTTTPPAPAPVGPGTTPPVTPPVPVPGTTTPPAPVAPEPGSVPGAP